MPKQCPNCNAEFTEHRDLCFYCAECESWFQNIDDKWLSCPEPVKPADPPPPQPPKPADQEPDPNRIKTELVPGMETNVRKYLGGLVTVTEDDEDETDD